MAPVALLRAHLTAAKGALALLVDNSTARLVVSMDLPVVPPDPRADPRLPSRSMRIVAC